MWRGAPAAAEWSAFSPAECRDVLLALLIDQLSGQLDDNSSKPDHEASSQLLSYLLEVLDRKDVVSSRVPHVEHSSCWSRGRGQEQLCGPAHPRQLRIQAVPTSEVFREASPG